MFDPGEGTQRQLTLAGVAASSVTRLCLSHFHGDHGLGVPGILQAPVSRSAEPSTGVLPRVGPGVFRPAAARLCCSTTSSACASSRLRGWADRRGHVRDPKGAAPGPPHRGRGRNRMNVLGRNRRDLWT
ncbi:MBL fold metallo-hydrolase [Candidatus Mycolicibacterium alkanivorans]|uniref:MBL fold metallo-hydrolase n=1 Tax=Candidatus Mycolicibacterium alkanivorans TaxID=2954114 RepID=UPI003557CCBC